MEWPILWAMVFHIATRVLRHLHQGGGVLPEILAKLLRYEVSLCAIAQGSRPFIGAGDPDIARRRNIVETVWVQ